MFITALFTLPTYGINNPSVHSQLNKYISTQWNIIGTLERKPIEMSMEGILLIKISQVVKNENCKTSFIKRVYNSQSHKKRIL
jgi:hypothetical protein